jgi:hypothetical protein
MVDRNPIGSFLASRNYLGELVILLRSPLTSMRLAASDKVRCALLASSYYTN